MDDAEFVLQQDIKEKKLAGRGSFGKVRGGGRYVKMPSDYLSRKERNKMNGDCVTYPMNIPVRWKVLRTWPEDLMERYIRHLLDDYRFTGTQIGIICGVSLNTVMTFCKAKSIKLPHGRKVSHELKAKFQRFCDGLEATEQPAMNQAAEAPVIEPTTVEEPEEAGKAQTAKATLREIDRSNIAAILSMLAGTGAKLTIEVTL